MADNALGWVSVPFVPTFEGITQRIEKGLVKPAEAASKKASGAVQKTADDMVKSLERQAAASKKKVDDLGKAAESAAGKEEVARQKVQAAIAKQKAAEEDYQKALAKGDSGIKELAKLEDAKAKIADANVKLKKAEQDTAAAQKKAKDQAEDYARTMGKLEDAQKSAKDEEDRHKGVMGGLRKEMDKAKAAADDAGDSFHDIGAKLKAGMTVAAGAVAGGLAGLVKVGTTFDSTWDTVRAGTGATGEAFEALKENIRNVAKESVGIGGDFEAIGATAADLNTRLGLTGKPLEDMTRSMLQLQELGVDADINSLSQAMNGFGVEAKDMPGMLDKMFQVSQATGLSVSELANSAVKAGPSLRGFGFDMADSAALVGQMDKAGLDADKTLQSMQRALAEFSSEGRDAPEALKETIGSIEELINAGDEAGAIDMASNIFGTRGAAQFVDAVKTGTLSVDDFMAATGATSDTINGVAEETADFAEKWDQFKLNALAALEPVASKIFDSIAPAMQLVIDKVMPLAASFAEQLGPVLEDVVGKLTSLGEWILKNKDYLVPLLVAVGTAIGLWKAWALGMTAVTTALKLAKAAQEGMNLAMKANVIGIVVTAIAALVAGLVWFFTKTETGRELWEKFTQALGDGWDWVVEKLSAGWAWIHDNVLAPLMTFATETLLPALQTVWSGIQTGWDMLVSAAQWAWENVFQPVFNGIWQIAKVTLGVIGTVILAPLLIYWKALSAGISWAWENVIQPVWQALSDFATDVLWPAIQQVLQWISDGWNAMKDAISFAWDWIRDNVIQPYIDAFHNLWNIVQSVIGWIGDKWNWLKDVVSAAWAWIDQNAIQPFMSGLQSLWNSVVSPVLGWISDKWNWLKDTMHATYQWIDGNVFTPFRGALERLKGFFGTVVEGIKTVWNGLKSALAAPINFMINTVYNGGIAKAWDTIGSFLPLKPKTATKLSPIGGYATGGAIRGPGSGTSDDIPAWLSNGEHVWTAKDVLKAGGQQAVYAMREAIQNGQAFSFDGNDLTLLPKHVDNKKGDLLGAAPSLFPAFKDGGEVRPMWELQLERAHKWAKSRSGRPYVLGGSADGAGGTDCSGFMSGIADVIGGGNGARQWATMAFNGGGNTQHPSGPQGFVAGLKAHTFSIGVTNGGAAGGHTAGTLGATSRIGAVNVESGGSPSMVKYGPGAVGANDGYFTTHYHLPIGPGGAFVVGKGSGGPSPEQMKNFILDKAKGAMNRILNPIESMLPSGPPAWKEIPRGVYRAGKEVFPKGIKAGVDALGDGLSTVYEAASEVGDIIKSAGKSATEWAGKKLGLYDTGGILPHGVAAFNHSGEDEFILKNSGMRSLGDLARAVGDLVPALRGHTDMVAKRLDSMQVSLAKVADPESIEGINLRSGIRKVLDLGLDLPGDEVISSILDGEKALWDSRERAIGHVEALAEKEKALEEARKAASELMSGPDGMSKEDKRKLEDAQKAVEEAKAKQAEADSDEKRAAAADKVADAEEKLKRVREDIDEHSEENAKKHAEEVKKANEAVTKAEKEYSDAKKAQAADLDNIVLVSQGSMTGLAGQARGLANQLIGMGAPAGAVQAGLAGVTGALSQVAGMAGPAGLTLGMVMDALKAAVNIVKTIVDFIKGIIERIRKARIEAYKALADGLGVIADYAKIIHDMQVNIAELQQSIVRGLMAQRTAEFNLKVAAQDRLIAEAEGHLKVAEARMKLDEEVRKGALAAQLKLMGLHEDWDTYMAFQALQSKGVLEKWSDAAISALFEYEKARAEALKGELQARVDYINAEAKLAEATRQNLRNQQDLVTAQERLIRMSAKVAGVDLEDATGMSQIAKLMAEISEASAKADKNVLGKIGAFFGAKGPNASAYRGQLNRVESLKGVLRTLIKETGANIDMGKVDRVLKKAASGGFWGQDPMDVLRNELPELVAAESALKTNEYLKPIYDIRDQKRELERKAEDLKAEIDVYEKVTPLEKTIKGLEYAIKGLGEKAQAWAKGNEKLRGDYLRSAEANEKAAEDLGVSWKLDPKYANGAVREQIRREITIHMDGEKMYTADQVDKLLAEVTAGTSTRVRVVRPASLVASTKRGEVI
ncbi:TPA: phage tail tape measure protein [Corynebacterium striatum]|nr:phage tail tape measure protein [Corynebacterium striatum]HAT1161163.1 phage tail tape measure protein [Corynebacterium striatum]HAT1163876.1 phage tail tape measure protein [Corynebacterium striatum]HAT1166631.1 phage tail tape measure protein [Corynebacterium striatum]HAT1279773.1 phage tail tape measure protein [Corynebacterium striatum]